MANPLRVKYVPTPRTFKDVHVAIYDYSQSELPIFEGGFHDAANYLKTNGYEALCNIENSWVKPKPPLTIPPIFHKIALLFKEVFNEFGVKRSSENKFQG
jgi:hypothetical protein